MILDRDTSFFIVERNMHAQFRPNLAFMPTTPERMFACKATIVHRDEDVIKFGLLVTEVFEGHNGQSKEFSPKSPYRIEESADEIIAATFPA